MHMYMYITRDYRITRNPHCNFIDNMPISIQLNGRKNKKKHQGRVLYKLFSN